MNLQNKEIEKVLAEAIENIVNGIINDDDQDVEEYLIPDFDKLQQEDQQLFINYILEQHPDNNFIKHRRFQNLQLQENKNEIEQIENQKELFQQFIKLKDWNQVINKFKDKDFCQENKIPIFWGSEESIKMLSSNKDILPMLLELIEVFDYQQGYNYLNQILIWFQLLSYAQDDKEQNTLTIEKLVGSSLEKQILQYQEYKEILEQINPQEFKNLMQAIQQTQLKQQLNYDSTQLDLYFQVCYIVQTRLIDKKYLDNYLRKLFQIYEQQINFKGLEIQVLKLAFQSNKIQELYFILMFYFLNQYCSQYNFQNDYELVEQKMSSLTDVTQKEKFIKFHCSKKMCKSDTFYQFLLSQLISLEEQQSNDIFSESFKKYRKVQEENQKQLEKLEMDIEKIFSSSFQDAITILNLMKKLPLKTIYQIKSDEKIQATILLNNLLLKEDQQIIFDLISSTTKQSLSLIILKLLEKQFQYQQSIIYLFLLIGIVYNHPQKKLFYFMNLYYYDDKFSNAEFLENICDLISFIQLNQKLNNQEQVLQKLSNSNEEWQIVDKIIDTQEIFNIYEQVFELYLNSQIDQTNKKFLYQTMQNFRKLNEKQQISKPFQVLVESLSQEDLNFLVQKIFSQTNSQKSQIFEKASAIIFQLIEQIYPPLLEILLDYLNSISVNKIFDFFLVKDLIQKGKDFKYIQYQLKLQFYSTQPQDSQIIEKCKSLFKDDQNIYQQIFDELWQSNILKITPEFLRNLLKFESLPRNANISLEDFNISLQEMSENDKQKLINDWSENMQNPNKFRKLIPFYFNIIKRKESSDSLLSQLNKNDIQKKQAFNMKAMFQVLYNNSNFELKQILLKLWSENNPLPLVFSNPNIDEAKTLKDLFCLNKQLNFLFPECFPIINFSLSKKQNQYGKTNLINQVFYKKSIFEVRDNCKLNQNTIDIMFDFCFNGSRNLAIADVHGLIPFEVMIKILPLFKFCIIQMDSEDELQENYESFKNIKLKLQQWNSQCCFIIRNSKTKQLNQLEIDIKNQGILIHKLIDLTQKDLDNYQINLEIESFSKFIIDKIKQQESNLNHSKDFLNVLLDYYGYNNPEVLQIQKDNQLLESIMQELRTFSKNPQGFYSQKAFPMRALMWQIKNLKQQQYQFDGITRDETKQIKKVESTTLQIKNLEKQIPSTKPTRILNLFQDIFDSEGYYNLYLKLTDELRKLNQQLIQQLQKNNQEINEDLQKKKEDKKKQRQNQNKDVTDISQIVESLRKQLEQNLKTIELRNIGIELFWRELIQIKQKGQGVQLKINPAQIIANMVKKGEPFEFLDGDQLLIDTKFLQEFIKKFPDPNEKVLVLSVLGPQSSGKSTILNKIFGCHFWTSVGRCTKGIYLQLLKITQKSYFDNQFDYILILDTEGLQNPNQKDLEFDKKIALFILAISDIILINVKGDIHSQFKNLVEMCVYTLGQMKSSLQQVKQLYWCFNQNNDCNNVNPFLQQIESIRNNLNLYINKFEDAGDNSNLDYNEVFDQKQENIKVLGFASIEQKWGAGINEDWRQQNINETFAEEAYKFGLQMIKLFLKKLNQQQENQLVSLSSFVQDVESHWQSICRFPDLLEFTELIQYQQDQSMKQKYEELLEKQQFDYVTKIQKISKSVCAKKNKNLEFFKELEKKEKQFIQQEKEQIQQNIENKLQQHKTENKIAKHICNKYIKQLENHLQTQEYYFHLILLDEIKKYEREFQQNNGFTYIEDLIQKISQNEQELQKIKGNKELFQVQFDQVWKKILDEAKKQQEQIFQDFSQASYQAIYSSFTQYQYNSQNSESYVQFFLELSKAPPIQQNYNEKQTIFKKYMQEIQSQQQFQIILNNNQNIKYYDIFCQPLNDRLKKSDHNYVVDLNNFFQLQRNFYLIPLKDFKQYLLSDQFYEDFNQFQKKQESNFQNIQMNKEQMINKVLREFICVLDYCQINYNKEKFNELKQYLISGNGLFELENKTKDFMKKFQQTFELSQTFTQVVQQPEFTRNISYYYPSLKYQQQKFQFENDQNQQMQFQYYKQDVLFFLNQKFEPKQQYQSETFIYIADQEGNQNLHQNFNSQIMKQFSEIMMKQEGWQRVYSEIYDIIKSKMITIKIQNNQQAEIKETLTSDIYLVKQIMAIIEQKILEYNKQFANFGIILSLMGERLIYYYSMFVIWRFSCYSKWNLIEENLQQLDQMKEDQLKRAFFQIEKQEVQLNEQKGRDLAEMIKQAFLDQFYSNQLDKVKREINTIDLKGSQNIQKLDQELLQNYKGNLNNTQQQEILDYILDQKGYIENQVDKIIEEKKEKIQKKYELMLRQELEIFLDQVFQNIQIIYKITNKQNKVFQSQDYFQINDDDYKNQQYNKKDYDSLLFTLIIKCIQGNNWEHQYNICNDLREIWNQQYKSINSQIFERRLQELQNQNKTITYLKPFIQRLYESIKNYINQSNRETVDLKYLQVQENLNRVKLSLIGCLHSCPMCKRKCDQQSDQNHKHSCSNGHYLRGMNGVLINNKPSLFTCEEIQDNSLIETSDSTIQKKWKDVKKAYPEWNFKNLNEQKVIELKEKMMEIWNNGIGKLVCLELSQKLHITIQFNNRNEFSQIQPKIHYILMLDDSGSMSGQEWENAKNGALQCMKDISKNGEAKVSVIIFNSNARVVIDCETVDIEKQKDLITYENGGTNFNNAFLKAYDQLQKHLKQKFARNVILFYTDGGDKYPEDAVKKFCKLNENIKQTLQLVSCAEGNLNQIASLVQLTDNFDKSGISAELKPNINVDDFQRIWSEVVNQNYHNINF